MALLFNFLFMKKFFAALALGAMLPASVFAAAPGDYAAKLNLNIRSLPSMSGLLIGHFNKGDLVRVLEVKGSWCRVDYKYRNAYVYCNLLASTGGQSTAFTTGTSSAPVAATNGAVTHMIDDAHQWLVNNGEGIDYINGSFFQARETAFTWDGEARIADFYFQWPLLSGSKCSMVFSGPYHAREVFGAKCFDDAGMVTTSKVAVENPQQGYNLPLLPFKNYLEKVVADKAVMASFDNYFALSKSLKGLFRLYKNADGMDVWEGKFIDEQSGYFMIVSADASKVDGGTLVVEKGRF